MQTQTWNAKIENPIQILTVYGKSKAHVQSRRWLNVSADLWVDMDCVQKFRVTPILQNREKMLGTTFGLQKALH